MNPETISKETSSRHLPNNPKYPDDRVVANVIRFVHSLKKSDLILRGLDVGCGVGRHMRLLQDLGFDAYGIEYASNVCDIVLSNFPTLKAANIYCGDYRFYDFEFSFDLIIAWGVIFQSKKSSVLANLLKLKQILNPKGQLIVNFRTRNNWFYGLGEEIEKDTYLIDSRGENYEGYIYSFFDKAEVEAIFSKAKLKPVSIEQLQWTDFSSSTRKMHEWLIYRLENTADH